MTEPRTGAERYFAECMKDPEFAKAHEEAKARTVGPYEQFLATVISDVADCDVVFINPAETEHPEDSDVQRDKEFWDEQR